MMWAVMARPRCKGTVKIVHYNKMQKQAYDLFPLMSVEPFKEGDPGH